MREQIEDYAIKLMTDAEDGNTPALKAYAELDHFYNLFKEAKEQIKEEALQELGDEKERIENGYQFKLVTARRKWIFDNVPAWKEKHDKLKELENELKKRYEFVKSSKPGAMPVGEDGEVLDIPKVQYSKEGLSVKPVRE